MLNAMYATFDSDVDSLERLLSYGSEAAPSAEVSHVVARSDIHVDDDAQSVADVEIGISSDWEIDIDPGYGRWSSMEIEGDNLGVDDE